MTQSFVRPEILAPAGDYDALRAAVFSGADAVYVGGSQFGARAYAKNFGEEDLIRAIDYVHLYGRKLYLTVNTVLKNSELNSLCDYIRPYYVAGLDGVIVQDLGVARVLCRVFPDLPLHASTQMAVTDVCGVKLLKEYGFKRVVLARELSLKEIEDIITDTGIEIECFVHGALCYSYSGKCLFSSVVGGRSGNRGRCAQPCRLPYNNNYLISAKDICTLEIIPDLIEAKIASFKIEGRMKSPEYVGAVTGIYKKYVDLFMSQKAYSVNKEDYEELLKLYTRSGNCKGYYYEKNGRDMITVDKPCYSSANEEEKKAVFLKYCHEYKLPIEANATIITGEPARLLLKYKDISVETKGAVVEEAKNRALNEQEVAKQLNKLGDTDYYLKSLNVNISDNAFMPVSLINNLRREGLKHLEDRILGIYRRKAVETEKDFNINPDYYPDNSNEYDRTLLHCYINSLNNLNILLNNNYVDIINIDYNALAINSDNDIISTVAKVSELIHDKNKKFYISLPFVVRKRFLYRIDISSLYPYIDGIVADNLEVLYYLKSTGYKGNVIGDIHLYAVNSEAAIELRELGVAHLTMPVELNRKELLRRNLSHEDMIVYGRLPMMLSAQCTMKTSVECRHDNGYSYITDRYGNDFLVNRNCSECLNVISNSVPNYILPDASFMDKLKPYSLRLIITDENGDILENVINCYGHYLRGEEYEVLDIKHTKGHYNRGVE